jgi:hypothetical protein
VDASTDDVDHVYMERAMISTLCCLTCSAADDDVSGTYSAETRTLILLSAHAISDTTTLTSERARC